MLHSRPQGRGVEPRRSITAHDFGPDRAECVAFLERHAVDDSVEVGSTAIRLELQPPHGAQLGVVVPNVSPELHQVAHVIVTLCGETVLGVQSDVVGVGEGDEEGVDIEAEAGEPLPHVPLVVLVEGGTYLPAATAAPLGA